MFENSIWISVNFLLVDLQTVGIQKNSGITKKMVKDF